MFLNWVYRANQSGQPAVDTCNLNPRPTPEHWAGSSFRNLAWSASPYPTFVPNSKGVAGASDTSLPGDRRFLAMDMRLRQIFTARSW